MAVLIPSAAIDDAATMRRADAALIEAALHQGRARLLALFAAYREGFLRVPHESVLNPPLWELGHLGWFEEFWIARNSQRLRGAGADPQAPRSPSLMAQSDSLYDSSRVAHASRWDLPLPGPDETLAYVGRVRERSLALLRASEADDASLYFFRLILFHADMHREAWVTMAQHLGVPLAGLAPAVVTAEGQWRLPAGAFRRGSAGAGFAFDNELAPHDVSVDAFTIDRAPVTWRRYLPFIEAGGYDHPRCWSDEGWAWRRQHSDGRPLHLLHGSSGWQRRRFGRLVALDRDLPAMHLSAHEAHAWCRWAGRRLPSEAEWEYAATLAASSGEVFDWGQVWEWTASPFTPYPGFLPHPYRDYSEPWFDGRPVLRGASFATAARMKHARYRNYFPAARNDLFAGLRCVSLV